MRTFFLVLVALVTVVGMFVQNAEHEAKIVKAYVEGAYNYVSGQVEENPNQIAASGLTMIVSTVIWLSILRITKGPGGSDILLEFKEIPKSNKENVDSPVVAKAKARQLTNQLEQEKAILEGRQRWMPEEIERIKKELNKAEQERRTLKVQYEIANENVENIQYNLKKLLSEQDKQLEEIHAIEDELENLKEMI